MLSRDSKPASFTPGYALLEMLNLRGQAWVEWLLTVVWEHQFGFSEAEGAKECESLGVKTLLPIG